MVTRIKRSGKRIAAILLTAILAVSLGFFVPDGQAASIANRQMTLSNANSTQTSVTYDFEGDHSGTAVKCIQTIFSTSVTDSGAGVPTGMTTTGASKAGSGWSGWTSANWTLDATANGTLKLTYATGAAGGSDYSFALSGITNSSTPGTYYGHVSTYTNTDCSTGATDSGVVSFAIFAGVTVQVSVAESLTASINGLATANCPNYDNAGAPNEVITTSTNITFGNVNVDTFYDGCQDLRVATNSGSGYTMTVQEGDQLTSGGDQIADGTCDGACTDSAEGDWATGGNNGFSYCMDDQATYGDSAETADAGWGTNGCDDANTYFKTIADAGAAEAAQTIMSSAGEVSDDRALIGFRLSVDAAQAAGTYQNTLAYIVTPTY